MAGRTSYRPSDAVEGGGIYDNVNATITGVKVLDDFDYDGRITDPDRLASGVELTLQPEGGDAYEQFYSIGNCKQWVLTEDGKALRNAADKGDEGDPIGLTNSSNFYMLVEALANAGADDAFFDRLEEDIPGTLTGILAYWQQQKQKERAGLENEYTDSRGQKRARTILLPSTVASWGGSSSKSSGTAKAAANDDEVEDAVFEALTATLDESEDGTLGGKDLNRWTVTAAKSIKADHPGVTSKVLKAIISDTDKVEEHGLTPEGEGTDYSISVG